MGNVPWDGMGQHALYFLWDLWDSSHVIAFWKLSLSETVDEQEIENLLNEHSDSEYEYQNDNEL